MDSNESSSYDDIKTAADFVLSKIPKKPIIGLMCGTGLGNLYEILKDQIDIPYDEIPGFPKCTIPGHTSILTYGTCSDIPIVCFRGRFHLYEGYSIENIVLPVRLFKLLGGELLILTNVSGGINTEYAKGDIMLIKDHINLVGLSGITLKSSDERWGPRLFGVTYNKNLLEKTKEVFAKCEYTGKVHEGVYVCIAGPVYETVAELKMLKLWGADAVGMSTVHEVTAAFHCGVPVVAFSLITDVCIDNYDSEEILTHEDVLNASQEHGKALLPFFEEFLPTIAKEVHTCEDVKDEEEPKSKKKSCACKSNPAK